MKRNTKDGRVKNILSYSLLIVTGSFLTASAVSHNSLISRIKTWRPYVQVAYAPTWVKASGTTMLQAADKPNPESAFTLNSTTHMNDYGLGFGVDFPISFQRRWINNLDFDLDYTNLSAFNVNGVYDLKIPAQSIDSKYNFNYRIKISTITLDANLELYQWRRVELFAGAGFDYAWIRTSDFSQTPQGSAMSNYINFNGSNQNQWFYHLNIGLGAKLSRHFRASIRDRYYPNIRVQTGAGTTGDHALSPLKNKLSMNQVNVALDYLF